MTLNLLVDGDSLARTQPEGRLSPPQLDSALSSLGVLLGENLVRAMVVISPACAEALDITQRSRFERFGHGTLVVAPADLHFRDFLVRAANDGSAIIVSNNAFTRQKELFPWLVQPGSGRHVLARQSATSSLWNFVEARPAGANRRSLSDLIGRAPLATPPFDAPSGPSMFWPQPGDDPDTEETASEDQVGDRPKVEIDDDLMQDAPPAESKEPTKTRRNRPLSKTPRKAQAKTPKAKEQ
jgi:hypothetical protein